MSEDRNQTRAVQRRLLVTLEHLLAIQATEDVSEHDSAAQFLSGEAEAMVRFPSSPATGRRILVVSGDSSLRDKPGLSLEMQGYIVLYADGREATAALRTVLPDLILFEMQLGKTVGLELLQQIRSLSSVPVIVLGETGKEDEAVHALELGADDWMTRPFGQPELLARIESVLRRAAQSGGLPEEVLLVDEDLTIDFARNRVVLRGVVHSLTATEHRLLRHLVANAGRLLPFAALLARVWGPDYREEVHYVRLYVSYLRAKIEPDSAHPRYILTEKGLGYRFASLQDSGNTYQQPNREPVGLGQSVLQKPLAVIAAHAESLLRQTAENGVEVRTYHCLAEQTARMLDLVDELLNLHQLRKGLLALEKTRFDLGVLVADKAEELQTTSKSHQLRIKVDEPLPVRADRRRIGVAIDSMLENAIQYSPGGSAITVTGRKERSSDGPATHLTLAVRDQGSGIAADDLPHIFDRYYQGRGKRLHHTMPHLGVGLYVARGVVEYHGGAISAESSEGQGSTFFLTLPN